jgi:centromeric protein E
MCALSACPRILLTIVFPTYEKLEDGNVKLQSRLEQEEEAKAALLARIQRLTKLILVSTKATPTSRFSPHPGPRRRHSFGEEEVCLYILTK